MAESETHQTPAAQEGDQRPWMPVVAVVAVLTAFVAGWRCGRGWGRLTGW